MTSTYVFQRNARTAESRFGPETSSPASRSRSTTVSTTRRPQLRFPGWIRYGSYYNENNPEVSVLQMLQHLQGAWPLLQNADMYTDIALLTPIPDLWTRYGVQTEPFGPGPLAVPYTAGVGSDP
ncbi:MAG: hypothetical protein ACLR8Y_08845 [Alistipes indistinctus]